MLCRSWVFGLWSCGPNKTETKTRPKTKTQDQNPRPRPRPRPKTKDQKPIMTNLTFGIIKPDAVRAGHTGRIIQRIIDSGFRIRALKLIHMSRKEAEGFYAVHRERPFFAGLTEF